MVKLQLVEEPVKKMQVLPELVAPNLDVESSFADGVNSVPIKYATKLYMVFDGAVFPDNYDFVMRVNKSASTVESMFRSAIGMKSVKLIADEVSGTVNMPYFVGCVSPIATDILETIDLTEFCTKPVSLNYAFMNRRALKYILGAFDFSNVTTMLLWLAGAVNVEEMRFVPGSIKINFTVQWCYVLTAETVQSIIDGLADITGQTAQTVTFHAAVGAKLTPEQKAAITAKNWILVY